MENPRITIVVGHYGSGKTEFALQYALRLADQGVKTALADLDIANPYFRSRQRQHMLESRGIDVYSNVYHLDITQDLPAVTASVRAPLENHGVHTIIDAGGDDSGARVLLQFRKYLTPESSQLFCVINANRPETSSLDGALLHVNRIEEELSLPISALVCNTHMLSETEPSDILQGVLLCREITKAKDIPLRFTMCPKALLTQAVQLISDCGGTAAELQSLFPFDGLLIRESWLDAHPERQR